MFPEHFLGRSIQSPSCKFRLSHTQEKNNGIPLSYINQLKFFRTKHEISLLGSQNYVEITICSYHISSRTIGCIVKWMNFIVLINLLKFADTPIQTN